jgi:hypothetical protein
MNIFFHTAAAISIGHMAAVQSPGDPPNKTRKWIIALAIVLAFLSHGLLDGLKHQYPFGLDGKADIPLSLALLGIWLLIVRREFRVLFLLVFLGSILPDVLDHGPAIANHLWHLRLPHPQGKIFPWHWPEGSGFLNEGRDTPVSIVNHVLVMCFIAAAVLSHSRWVFRPFLTFKRSVPFTGNHP